MLKALGCDDSQLVATTTDEIEDAIEGAFKLAPRLRETSR